MVEIPLMDRIDQFIENININIDFSKERDAWESLSQHQAEKGTMSSVAARPAAAQGV